MFKIKYSPELDFVFYTYALSNASEMKAMMDKEIKNKSKTLDKETLERREKFFGELSDYYDNLSFIERNSLDLFFHQTDIIYEFLMKLLLKGYALEDMSIDHFKDFCNKKCECDISTRDTYKDVFLLVEEHYAQPDGCVDLDKTTNLIVDILKEPRVLEESVKGTILSLLERFVDKKVNPVLDQIEETLIRHQVVYDQDPLRFIDNLSHGSLSLSEVHDNAMQPYLTYNSPDNLIFSVTHQSIIYGVFVETLKKKDETELLGQLVKFLSDNKRYKMIKKLGEKTWYANELAKEFGITPATMSYHVNKLFKIGIIHFEQGDQNRMYMSLDKKRLENLLDKIKLDLLQ
jgi:DNA-binding transcriptional ArsR family regulator